jgi:hypothetical protein
VGKFRVSSSEFQVSSFKIAKGWIRQINLTPTGDTEMYKIDPEERGQARLPDLETA